MAQFFRRGGSHITGTKALSHRNIHLEPISSNALLETNFAFPAHRLARFLPPQTFPPAAKNGTAGQDEQSWRNAVEPFPALLDDVPPGPDFQQSQEINWYQLLFAPLM